MEKKCFMPFFLLLFFVVTGGSITGMVPVAVAAPLVSDISPKGDACITQLNQSIAVTFSEAMDPNSVINSFSLTPAVAVNGVADTANTVFTFTSATNLTVDTNYTITISTAATNASGVALGTPFTSAFQTNATCVPRVISHSPADGSNIGTSGVITATFSTPMNAGTINQNTFTVTMSGSPVNGSVTMNSTSTTATFKPASSLVADTTYVATISKSVKSTGGTSMTDDVMWTFSVNESNFQNTGVTCFIATAAYGSYLDPHVKVLRDFRDRYLITNAPGSMFVNIYYDYSPAVADYIAQHESLRLATRCLLTPLVYAIEYPLSFFVFMGVVVVARRKRKRSCLRRSS